MSYHQRRSVYGHNGGYNEGYGEQGDGLCHDDSQDDQQGVLSVVDYLLCMENF